MSAAPTPPDPRSGPDQQRLAEPLASRWSPRGFDPDHVVSAADVDLLLTAVRWAPSWGNRQPWRLVVAVRGSATHEVVVRHLTRGNAGWVPAASLVLVVGALVDRDPTVVREAEKPAPDPLVAAHDVGQAIAHLTVQAAAMGLALHSFAGVDLDAVAAELAVPAHVRLLAGHAVGRVLPPDAPGRAGLGERVAEWDERERDRRPIGDLLLDVGEGGTIRA